MRIKINKTTLKKIAKAVFNKAVVITLLSALAFAIPALIDGLVLRKQFNLSGDKLSLATIGFSLVVVALNLLIAKKWLSFKEIGLRKSGIIKSLFYSLIFVALLRVIDFFDHKRIINKNIAWDKTFFLNLSTYLFSAFQEEVMFRGVIFKVWEKYKGFLVALFISCILFGLAHLLYPIMGFERVTAGRAFSTALFGPTLVLIAYRTKNIWGITLSHFLYNVSFLITERVMEEVEPKATFPVLHLGVSIFLPILIDFIERKIFKNKGPQIIWSKYLAGLFVIFFTSILVTFAFDDLGWSKNDR